MGRPKLSEIEINLRLTRLRNLERMYRASREREAIKDARIAELELIAASQQAQIDTLRIQLAELQTMVFGKNRRPPTSAGGAPQKPTAKPKPPRTAGSYRRPTPPDSAVTHTELNPVSDGCSCGGQLTNITKHERFVQDIPLPDLTAGYQPVLVTKYVVERGICARCGRATSGRDLGGAVVALGSNVRLLVCHLVSTAGMSYSQVQHLFMSLYGLDVSDGEIAGILSMQSKQWQPSYQQLAADVRGAPVVHADETPWPIARLEGLGYAWVLCPAGSPQVYLSLEGNRGAIHAQNLFGPNFSGVRISDDYAPYRTLPGSQQLCWAHLYRCIRDLRYNSNLPEEQLPDVAQWYEAFAEIYADLRRYLDESFDAERREDQSDGLWARLQTLLAPIQDEPEKLTRLKAQLTRAGQDKLFICLAKDTPCDNNRAERDLRGLVLKRKRSFGSKTPKGARALGVILSMCLTTWRTSPENYFRELAALGV
jgi:transposase